MKPHFIDIDGNYFDATRVVAVRPQRGRENVSVIVLETTGETHAIAVNGSPPEVIRQIASAPALRCRFSS